MISINTNLSSLIVQKNLKSATKSLNQTIERLSTGFRINHAKDNAANYCITKNMSTKISSFEVAEDNTNIGLDYLMTAEASLSLINQKLIRLRNLAMQSENDTYGKDSQLAINSEVNALIDEMERIHDTTEYNGKNILGDDKAVTGIMQTSYSPTKTQFTRINTTNLKKLESIEDPLTDLPDGTYSISSATELAQLAEMTNSGLISAGDTFVLANDIDLSDFSTGEGWVPIGTIANKFTGTFNGNGYTISNLTINRPDTTCQGLFGDANNATLKNINIKNANITANIGGGILMGAQRGGSTSNCHTEGVLVGKTHSFGGIVGQFYGEIKNCSSNVKIEGNSNLFYRVGGLIGHIAGGEAKVDSCYAISNISGTNDLGGLIGRLNNTATSVEIRNSYAKTEIINKNESTYSNFTGGFIGVISSSNTNITNCFAEGNILVDSASTNLSCLGGFLGGSINSINNLNINNCHSNVGITYNGNAQIYNIGGFSGQLCSTDNVIININNCYSTGDLNLSTTEANELNNSIGGFVGFSGVDDTNYSCNINISNSYSTGKLNISAPKLYNIGGFEGAIKNSNTNLKNCYTKSDINISATSNCNYVGGFLARLSSDISNVITIENCYNQNKINTNLASGATTDGIGGFWGDIKNANIKNSYMLADKDSDITTIWGKRNNNITFNIENSYFNRDLAQAGIPQFIDTNDVPINNPTELAQIKTCATDSPFELYFNQSSYIQVGINGSKYSGNIIDTTLSLKNMNILRNIGLQNDDNYLKIIDELMKDISLKQTEIGTGENRLLATLDSIYTQHSNLVNSCSTLKDADIAEESTLFIKQQILQNACATLLSTANQSPGIALGLI